MSDACGPSQRSAFTNGSFTMPGLTTGPATSHGFLRSATILAACMLAVALALTPFALNQSGSGGMSGLAVAATICLLSGLAAEAVSIFLARSGTPLAAAMVGMALRMLPPLVLCVALALSGQNGRQHLAFVLYLLAFYLTLLVIETCLAVRRVPATTSSMPAKHVVHSNNG